MIAEAAYHKAERHSFAGDPFQYWVEAEAEIDKMLKEKKRKAFEISSSYYSISQTDPSDQGYS